MTLHECCEHPVMNLKCNETSKFKSTFSMRWYIGFESNNGIKIIKKNKETGNRNKGLGKTK